MSDRLEQWRAESLEATEGEGGEGMLPPITRIDLDNMPKLRPELIEGVLRVGHVMMVGGASKVGKLSFCSNSPSPSLRAASG